MTIATQKAQSRRRAAVLAFGAVWLILIIAGMVVLAKYSGTSGQVTNAPAQWPGDVPIELSATEPTVLMFAHPHCPCTRASVSELERMIARTQGEMKPWIVFYKPSGAESGWEQTGLWRAAESLPGARVILDEDGGLAKRFRAATSGYTLVYDPQGKLLFQGGITAARGHAGHNAGEDAVMELMKSRAPCCTQTPTFGCPIVHLPQETEN